MNLLSAKLREPPKDKKFPWRLHIQSLIFSFHDVLPSTRCFFSGITYAGTPDFDPWAVRSTFAEQQSCYRLQPFREYRPSGGHRSFRERQSCREPQSYGGHLHHDELMVGHDETLYRPNDARHVLCTRDDCSSSGSVPNPSSGYGTHRNVSDDILAANQEYNQAVSPQQPPEQEVP
jgi:hypothetical protein